MKFFGFKIDLTTSLFLELAGMKIATSFSSARQNITFTVYAKKKAAR
jgi:hypothetical protein